MWILTTDLGDVETMSGSDHAMAETFEEDTGNKARSKVAKKYFFIRILLSTPCIGYCEDTSLYTCWRLHQHLWPYNIGKLIV